MTKSIHVLSRAVIICEDHILLAYDPRTNPHHYYELNVPLYYLPGGHIEWQESAQAAVVREIREEIGYSATVERFLGIVEHAWNFPGNTVCCHTHEINLIFNMDVPDLHLKSIIPQQEDHVAVCWIPLSDLMTIDLRPQALKTCLMEWLKNKDSPIFQSTML